MDLQAILDASDSEDGSHGSHVDLERILREEDADDLSADEPNNRNDFTVTSMSTISTHHLPSGPPPPPARHVLLSSRKSSEEWDFHSPTSTSRYPNDGTLSEHPDGDHNAEDFAVLQRILCEDDEEEEDGEGIEVTDSGPKTMDVDAILESIQSDDEDENLGMTLLPTMEDYYVASPKQFRPTPLQSASTPVISGSTGDYYVDRSPITDTKDLLFPASNYEKEKDDEIDNASNDNRTAKVMTPKVDSRNLLKEEAATEAALKNALAYERRLLRPSQRDIVSPLMVKRRLKPKLEVGSYLQKKQLRKSGETMSKPTNVASANTPRFAFSGVMEHRTMPTLSSQLMKNSQKTSVGLPTALSVNSKFIAVGTQKGVILVFDHFEVLRHRLIRHPSEDLFAPETGSVTSVDISGNGEAILAGYASGILILWDAIKGQTIKTITDVHPSPITVVRFLTEKDFKAVTVDAGGLVNKLSFSKNIIWSTYSLETECLLDGTAGQILCMDVLAPFVSPKSAVMSESPVSPAQLHTFVRKLVLVALSSERSSFAVAVEPSINVLHRWSRPPQNRIKPVDPNLEIPSDHEYLPCLSWGWSLVSGGSNMLTPILARAWGCCIQFLRATFPTLEVDLGNHETAHWPAFGMHDEFDVSAPVVALEWLGERSLVFLTVTNEFTVVDSVMMTITERLDFSGLKLVYAEFKLSRLSSRSDDDEMFNQSSKVCSTFQNAIRASDSRLLVLCQEEVKKVSILGAKRRISSLEEDGEWLEALALALDHYENTVKSQEDRRRDPDRKRDLSKHPEFASASRTEDEEWIAKLLMRYFNLAVENAPEADRRDVSASPHRLDLAQSHFQMLAGVCIEFCIVIRRLDLLFGPIFRRFCEAGYVSVFLDVMEPYILNEKLKYIAPEVMSYFVEHCRATNGISTVERCLLHMDVTIMDFDSIISLLRQNEMFSALFHVFTKGLDDFVTPLEIVLERMFDAADDGQVDQDRSMDMPKTVFQRLGLKAILFLQQTLLGKAFPQERDLEPEGKLQTIRPSLLKFLCQEEYKPSGNFVKPSITGDFKIGCRRLPYPYTHVLLLVNARAVLDSFSFALDASDDDFGHSHSNFESIGGWEVEVGADEASEQTGNRSVQNNGNGASNPDRQLIISMLSSIMLPDDENRDTEPYAALSQSKMALDAFLDFMAKYLVKGVVRANKAVVFLIISRMSDKYQISFSPEARQAAQDQVIELLSALPRNAYDHDDVLRLIETAGIHRAALLLHQQGAAAWHEGGDHGHQRARHFKAAIECYLDDADRAFRLNVFDYAKKECSGSGSGGEDDSGALKKVLSVKLPVLVDLAAVRAAQLVAELYVDELDDVIRALKKDVKGQFKLLHAIISGNLGKLDVVSSSVLSANLTVDHHQTYLSLMAKLHPDMVYQYLSTHDTYRADDALRLCQQYEIADASAYLLEKMGNVSSALQLVLQTLEGRLMALKRTIRGMGIDFFSRSSSRSLLPEWKKDDVQEGQRKKQKREVDGVKRILVVALDLCERNAGSVTKQSEQGSQLWFNVLDRLINAKGFLRLSKEQPVHAQVMAGVLSDLLQLTMQRLVSSVPLPDLVRKVTTDHSGSRLGEMREMVESLLSTYGHDLDVCNGAVHVMQEDVLRMEKETRLMKIQGSCVRSVMEYPLEGRAVGAGFAESYARLGSRLMLDENGRSRMDDAGQVAKKSVDSGGGFKDALGRLRATRLRMQSGSEPSQLRISFMVESDFAFYEGESSEAVELSGSRVRGRMGEASSYGSLHWI